MEELRPQKLRLREEAARLEKSHAKDTSVEKAKRSDAEAARRIAAGTAATGTGESWVDTGGTLDTSDDDPTVDRTSSQGAQGRLDMSYRGCPSPPAAWC